MPHDAYCCLLGLCRSKILWPLAFLIIFVGTMIHEVVWAVADCSCNGMTTPDARWVSRGTACFLLPLLFALTMDEVPAVGNYLGLSWDANERLPPRFFRVECLVPCTLVGLSFACFIPCFAWIVCCPKVASIAGAVGLFLLLSGCAFSRYLRGHFSLPCCPQQQGDVMMDLEAARIRREERKRRQQKSRNTDTRSRQSASTPEPKHTYHPNDHIVGKMANLPTRSGTHSVLAEESPKEEDPPQIETRTIIFGVFDYNSEEFVAASIHSKGYDHGQLPKEESDAMP